MCNSQVYNIFDLMNKIEEEITFFRIMVVSKRDPSDVAKVSPFHIASISWKNDYLVCQWVKKLGMKSILFIFTSFA